MILYHIKPIWIILDHLGLFETFLTILNRFEQYLTHIRQFWTLLIVLDYYRLFMTILDNLGLFLFKILDHILTYFILSKHFRSIWAFLE